jgi:hypothetical protein
MTPARPPGSISRRRTLRRRQPRPRSRRVDLPRRRDHRATVAGRSRPHFAAPVVRRARLACAKSGPPARVGFMLERPRTLGMVAAKLATRPRGSQVQGAGQANRLGVGRLMVGRGRVRVLAPTWRSPKTEGARYHRLPVLRALGRRRRTSRRRRASAPTSASRAISSASTASSTSMKACAAGDTVRSPRCMRR